MNGRISNSSLNIQSNIQPQGVQQISSQNQMQTTFNQQQLLTQMQSLYQTPGITKDEQKTIQMLMQTISVTTDPNVLNSLLPQINQIQQTVQKQTQKLKIQKQLTPQKQSIIDNANKILKTPNITQQQQQIAQQLITQTQQAQNMNQLINLNNQLMSLVAQVNQLIGGNQNNQVIIQNIKSVLSQAAQTKGLTKNQQDQINIYNQKFSMINTGDIQALNKFFQEITNFYNGIITQTATSSEGSQLLKNMKIQINKISRAQSLNSTQKNQIVLLTKEINKTNPNDIQTINKLNNQVYQLQSSIEKQIGQLNGALGRVFGTVSDKQSLQNVCGQLNQMSSIQKSRDGSSYILIIAHQPSADNQFDGQLMSNVMQGLNTIWQQLIALKVPIIEIILDEGQQYRDQIKNSQSIINQTQGNKKRSKWEESIGYAAAAGVSIGAAVVTGGGSLAAEGALAVGAGGTSALTTGILGSVNHGKDNKQIQQIQNQINQTQQDLQDSPFTQLAPIRLAIESLQNPKGINDWRQYYPGIYLTTVSNLLGGGNQYTMITARPEVDSSAKTALSPQAFGQTFIQKLTAALPQQAQKNNIKYNSSNSNKNS